MLEATTTGGGQVPPLSLLQLEMQVNASDRTLLSNLTHTASLGLPDLAQRPEHERVLAIVGSGPSLRETHGLIPPDCDVMALNGAYRFLCDRGRVATYFAMLDARACNTNFLEDPRQETAFLMASQCAPEVFRQLAEMRTEVFHLCTPTTRKVFPEQPLYLGGGGTIGLTAIALAIALGYRTVMLYGFDSSFAGDSKHAAFQPQNEGMNEIDVWVQDRQYRTTHAMAAQSMDFFPFYTAIRRQFPKFAIHLVGSGLFYDFVTTNNHPTTRERELSKYGEAYQQADYGMTTERRDGLDKLIGALPCKSYLDVSTGRGETLAIARKHGYEVVKGTETVEALCNEHVTRAVLPNIPHPDKSFEVVSLVEVIEHLLPDDIRPALAELTRLASKHILISAAVQECWIGGVNLHPSAMPVEQWDELFHDVWGDKAYRVGQLGGSPVWRVDL
jgi:hypothetical protein